MCRLGEPTPFFTQTLLAWIPRLLREELALPVERKIMEQVLRRGGSDIVGFVTRQSVCREGYM